MLSRMAGVAEGSSSSDPAGTRAIEAAAIEPTTKTTTRTGDAGIRCMFLFASFLRFQLLCVTSLSCSAKDANRNGFSEGKRHLRHPLLFRPCKFFHLEVGRLRLPLLF